MVMTVSPVIAFIVVSVASLGEKAPIALLLAALKFGLGLLNFGFLSLVMNVLCAVCNEFLMLV